MKAVGIDWRQTMSGSSISRTTLGMLLTMVMVGGGILTGCGGAEERSLLRNFFTASRVNDRATLGNIAMVGFDPNQEGTVGSFDVVSVGEEERRPMRMRELATAVTQAELDQQEFAGQMKLYQDENLEAIARVIEAERASENVAARDREEQEAWAKWRAESQEHSRAVSGAESALSDESAVAQVSAFDPNNPLDVQAFEGELVTKEVTINASVERNDVSEDREMVILLQKVELKGSDGMIDGRWVISEIS